MPLEQSRQEMDLLQLKGEAFTYYQYQILQSKLEREREQRAERDTAVDRRMKAIYRQEGNNQPLVRNPKQVAERRLSFYHFKVGTGPGPCSSFTTYKL